MCDQLRKSRLFCPSGSEQRSHRQQVAGGGGEHNLEVIALVLTCPIILQEVYSVHNIQIKQPPYFTCYLLFGGFIQFSICIIKSHFRMCVCKGNASHKDLTESVRLAAVFTTALVLCQHSTYSSPSKLILIQQKQTA